MTTTEATTPAAAPAFPRAPLVAPPSRVFMGVRIFDCRLPEEVMPPITPWGESLWGSERAAWALGLRKNWSSWDRPILSLQLHQDLRTDPDAYRDAARRMVREFKARLAQFEAALNAPRVEDDVPQGVLFRPLAVALCNFGATLIGDGQDRATYPL